jgi:CRISPR system Cascade subunit CasB
MTTDIGSERPIESSISSIVARMAALIGATHYPNGDRAALRRWAPGQPIPMAFHRLWLWHVGEELPLEGQIETWMVIAWGLATLAAPAHIPGRRFGQALAEAGYAEGRLERLLSAPDDVRIDLFMDAVRFLAAKHQAIDWHEAAEFLLVRNGDKRLAKHLRIAQSYYRQLSSNA